MLIKRSTDLNSGLGYSDVTPRELYLNRRKFLQDLGLVGGAALAGKQLLNLAFPQASVFANTKLNVAGKSSFSTYNNFYEFGTDKGDPSKNAKNFRTSPWTVSVEGEVNKPRKFSMDEILKLAPLEERIYRHRCVEAWSIVVPWSGFSFSELAKLVEPKPSAKFVAFQTFYDPAQMPQGRWAGIE